MRSWLRRHLVRLVLALLGPLALVGAASAAAVHPLKVGPTGRYLVDQNNVPFLIAGESPQAMIGAVSEADAELFFINRHAHGFNTVLISLLCNNGIYVICRSDGSTFDGILPFTTVNDLATPNEAYFARADRIIQLAAQHGLLVILNPAETAGWLGVLRGNGVDKSRAYGQYLGQRYAAFDNILWMSGNDFQTWPDPDDDAVVQAVARGIQDFDTRHLHTVLLNFFVSSSLDDPTWRPLIQLNSTYTYELGTYAQVLLDYNRPAFLPSFMAEASYEGESTGGVFGTTQVLRRQIYWSLLSGAAGQLWGNTYTWQFLPGWRSQLDSPGAVQMAYVTGLFEPRAWFQLVPDQAHTLVTAGLGTFGATDYVTAARTPDGTLALAYVPHDSAGTITAAMGQLSGPVTARWYDPTTGTFAPIPGSPFANSGALNLTRPGSNADGDRDWVLLLEVVANADSTPPTIAITSPTTGETFITGSALLTLGGVAADDVGVTQVTWTNSRGGGGTATGTTSWTASGIELKVGPNVLTVTARDAAGNVRTDSLTVCRTLLSRVGGFQCR